MSVQLSGITKQQLHADVIIMHEQTPASVWLHLHYHIKWHFNTIAEHK